MWGTHRDLGAVSQAVVEDDAQGEVDVFCAEGARLLDLKLVPVLLDGDLQVVVLGQFALHHVDAWNVEQKKLRHVSVAPPIPSIKPSTGSTERS